VSPTQLKVRTASGEQAIDAKNVIVATGSKVGMPPIKGLAESKPLDNVGALSLTTAPKRLIVIGGGAIGLELGTFYAELGAEVTVLEMLPQPIAYADPELVRLLVRALQARGITIVSEAKVTEVSRSGGTVRVTAEVGGASKVFEGDEVPARCRPRREPDRRRERWFRDQPPWHHGRRAHAHEREGRVGDRRLHR
jgi:dihydrolipoamide dehydrogenase